MTLPRPYYPREPPTTEPRATAGPPPFADVYSDVIERSIRDHPRSAQTRIGPSELGDPCDRKLLTRLAGVKCPERGALPWKPAIGTAMHSQLEEWFEVDNLNWGASPRWVTEMRVNVGTVGGEDIWGSSDLYDLATETVADHKVVGLKQIAKYRIDGPPDVYRRQAMLYGLGFVRAGGYGVPKRVAICFLPRDGEWEKRFVWEAPWDPALAMDTLNRANRLHSILATLGLEAALAAHPLCDGRFCDACAPHRPTSDPSKSLFLQ